MWCCGEKRWLHKVKMESKLRLEDEDYEDEKGKQQNKLDGFSSPRKRLLQAKIQANAIDDEVTCLLVYIISYQNEKIAHYKLTQSLSRNFVGEIIADTVYSLCETKTSSK